MIDSWQVWLADLDPIEGHEQAGVRPVVIVSSDFHIRLTIGRAVTVIPLTRTQRPFSFRVPVENPHNGQVSYAMTDQVRTIDTRRFERSSAWWTLKDDEIFNCRRALRAMVDY